MSSRAGGMSKKLVVTLHCIGNQARPWLSKLGGDISIQEVGITCPVPMTTGAPGSMKSLKEEGDKR